MRDTRVAAFFINSNRASSVTVKSTLGVAQNGRQPGGIFAWGALICCAGRNMECRYLWRRRVSVCRVGACTQTDLSRATDTAIDRMESCSTRTQLFIRAYAAGASDG
jgi:hypothetical protein